MRNLKIKRGKDFGSQEMEKTGPGYWGDSEM